jgi:hypothetical protein
MDHERLHANPSCWLDGMIGSSQSQETASHIAQRCRGPAGGYARTAVLGRKRARSITDKTGLSRVAKHEAVAKTLSVSPIKVGQEADS